MNNPFDLTGKAALVTGASRGIGRAIALAFAEAGADVILTARSEGDLDRVAHEIEALGRTAVVSPADIGDANAIQVLIDCLTGANVPVDILVNNAATATMGPLLETDPADWRRLLDVNVTGPLLLTRAIVPLMAARGGGAIVNIASIAGLEPAYAMGAYAVTKAALIHMTRVLAHELAPKNIRVNAIAPGLIETKFAAALTGNPAIADNVKRQTPLARLGRPEDIAGAAVYLCSDAASFVTGEVLVIDGGLTIGTVGI